jgi:hypothetical protein
MKYFHPEEYVSKKKRDPLGDEALKKEAVKNTTKIHLVTWVKLGFMDKIYCPCPVRPFYFSFPFHKSGD